MNSHVFENPVGIKHLNKIALELRKKASEELSNTWQRIPAETVNSHFAMYGDILPLPSGKDAFCYNDAVTTLALEKYVLNGDDPYFVTHLAAKVVEQTYYQFFDPQRPGVPYKNLSVAKHFGTFFTPPDIARIMAEGLTPTPGRTTLVDPCVGSGVLLCAALLCDRQSEYNKLVGLELDLQLAQWSEKIVSRVANLVGYFGQISILQGDGLEYLLDLESIAAAQECDIIINPPYGRFRVTADRATNAETAFVLGNELSSAKIKDLQSHVTDNATAIRKKAYFLQHQKGILEYSRVFFRACAEHVSEGGRAVIISPDSWLCGNDGADLRQFVITNRLVDEIILVPEDRKNFSTVNQSAAITFMSKEPKVNLRLTQMAGSKEEGGLIPYNEIINTNNRELLIPRVAGKELALYRKLHKFDKLGNLGWVRNARGEIDQTLQKELFVNSSTGAKLVRGKHIERYSFAHSSSVEKPSFLNEIELGNFLAGKPKAADVSSWRIVGRQCSYAQQKRRLIFAIVPPNHVVGNSCNYLTFLGDQEVQLKRRYLLMGLLNSAVLDWYFGVVNSNNHVGNYEIDGLPFPIEDKWFDLIASTARQCEIAANAEQATKLSWLQPLLEAAVGLSFNLDLEAELRPILDRVADCNIERAINYAIHLKRGIRIPVADDQLGFYNHSVSSLSALDRLVISHVPEGGNWQNIPDTVPGERLKQIRAMTAERGVVRTTYYGRLRRDQPAYTINTYFNRPGNGTHIHPALDRTLTAREAARLQSFPDSYLFVGSDTAVRNQIGNAVPPLLAKAVGEALFKYHESGLCVDMFGGAGGLSLGLESAGWHTLAVVDYDREALDTYALNRPCDLEPEMPGGSKTAVYRRDLHDLNAFEDVVSRIQAGLKGRSLDLLAGGPPCQGFSHAGFRLDDDARNDLAATYLHFADRLRPKIFILENVEGLATFKKGQVLRDICSTLKSFGYRVTEPVWRLHSEQYGVPQMRRRVFVVATLDPQVNLAPPLPTHEKCAGRREAKRGSLFEATLMQPTTVAEALAGLSLTRVKEGGELTSWLEGQI